MSVEYTHRALIAAGWERTTEKDHKQPGFVCYRKRGTSFYSGEVVAWVGNNAMMNDWVENISCWKKNYPAIYKWYTDPTQTKPFPYAAAFESGVMIKGEDPMLTEKEGQHGS